MSTTAPAADQDRGTPNTTWGLIKDRSLQLKNGYLDRTPMFQFILLSICFPMWGMAASMNDILITQFKAVFTLSDFASAFVQSAFYGGYFVIAIPASRIIRRFSYKAGLLIGLSVYIAGCLLFFPASTVGTYTVFLASLFAIAIGLSFLETSANTYSSLIGSRRRATLRLNVSQTFTAVGFLGGALLGKFLVFDDGDALHRRIEAAPDEATKQQIIETALGRTLDPYRLIIVALVILVALIAITQYPKCKPQHEDAAKAHAPVGETLTYLLKNRMFVFGVIAQFFYVGVQTALWSFTIRLALNMDTTLNEKTAANYLIAAFIAFFIGKIIANLLISRMNEDLVVMIYSALGVLVVMYVVLVPNFTAVYAAVVASALLGPGWATIYARNLDTITDKRYTETGGAIIVMSIIGGAVIPAVQGLISDLSGSMQFSFIINAVCFAVMLTYFIAQYRTSRHAKDASLTEEAF
ncbi:L-fucose:H+ symporter permease [Helcobacillus sp. ACRRO]|uniref:L-fucose:H+ symporter permease n=1 Tax=Helcobacillus TaxID=1161125 RepID=UPI001EF6F13C|nr:MULTISPECIES: L-fucose:H+ symporter permease [Helcobacillus]MCG7427083.1 L-fucose:H+ symporter permease [Helcobacillus sp. ACRRO]MDK7742962.1 L-fucose:H+ symporter permease [Helcobacillus massiliensis]WOO93404.1 L-fucose:H+ symporter permease [Helcobacillus massiliensis]